MGMHPIVLQGATVAARMASLVVAMAAIVLGCVAPTDVGGAPIDTPKTTASPSRVPSLSPLPPPQPSPSVTALVGDTAGCPTSTIDLEAIASTAESDRARCFGSGTIHFEARGGTFLTTWGGIEYPPFGTTWVLRDRTGDLSMVVFLPDQVTILTPADAPWRNRDGIGGKKVWWRISGHFDDPKSMTCQPRLLDEPRPMTLEQAIAFCRNLFVIDAATWLRDR